MWKRIIWLIIPLLLWVVPVQAQGSVAYTRYDVEIVVQADGRLLVREIQHLRFNGRFKEGFAEIPLAYTSQIRGISVYGGTDITQLEAYEFIGIGSDSYRFEVDDDFIYVDWQYEETSAGDEMVFVLEYEVEGGLWVYDEVVTMEWRAIAADRGGLTVPQSRVTVDLPFAVTADQLDTLAFGSEHTTRMEPLDVGQRVIFETTEPILDGTRFQVIVDFPLGLVTAQKQAWQVEADEARLEYTVDGVDIEMMVSEDGHLHITENQHISVQTGVVNEGFRIVEFLFVDDVNNFQINEGDQQFEAVEGELCDYCYQVRQSERQSGWVYYDENTEAVETNAYNMGGVEVVYGFPGLVRGESSTFTVAYEAKGTFSVADDGHLLTWTAVPGEAVMPQEATVTLQLPSGLGLEDVTIEGAIAERADGGIVLRPEFPLAPWQDWQFTLLLPPGTLNTTPPIWQTEFEAMLDEAAAREAEKAAVEARRQLAVRAGGIGAGVTAVLGALVGWYLWGSRKVREVMGNYRTTPPNDLPPGVVAYLLDKEATSRGALASLFYLADLGLIRLNVGEQLTLERLRELRVAAGEKIATPVGMSVQVPGHVAVLFNNLIDDLPVGKAVTFSAVQALLQSTLPLVYLEMAQEMVTFFYGRSGQSLGRRLLYRVAPLIAFAVPMTIAVFGTSSSMGSLFWGLIAFVSAIAVFIGSIRRQNRGRQTLSRLGEAEAKKWQGFKAYLQDIQKHGDLAEAQEILDRYFAYAVALGVEETLLAQVGELGGYAPVWVGNGRLHDGTPWQNRPYDRRLHHRRWHQRGSWLPKKRPITQTQPAAANGRPSLQTISDSLTRSLNNTSKKMTDLLNTAVGASQAQSVTINAAGQTKKVEWQPGSSINKVVSEIMKESNTIRPLQPVSSSSKRGGSGSGFRSSGSSSSSSSRRRSSSSRSSSRRSSRSSSRRSSSRRSGGGGRRGFK